MVAWKRLFVHLYKVFTPSVKLLCLHRIHAEVNQLTVPMHDKHVLTVPMCIYTVQLIITPIDLRIVFTVLTVLV